MDPADTAVLIDIATATGLFAQAEAVSLLGGILEALHTGAYSGQSGQLLRFNSAT